MTEYVLLIWSCSVITSDCHWHFAGVYRNEATCVMNALAVDSEPFPRFKCEKRKQAAVPLPRPRPATPSG